MVAGLALSAVGEWSVAGCELRDAWLVVVAASVGEELFVV